MKVLMLGWELPPHNSGGLGVACYQLCKTLSKNGIDIEFVLPYSADFSDIEFMRVHAAHPKSVSEISWEGGVYDSHKYIYEDGSEEYLNIYQQQAIYETAVGRLAPNLDFDVIHAHDWLTFRAGLRVRQQVNKPLILHVHSIESDRSGRAGGGNPLVREIEELSMLMADRVVAVSEFTKQAIVREYDIPAEKIDVVHNSLDLEMVEPLEGNNAHKYLSEMKKHGYKVVANIGRITIQKGLTNLIYAAKAVIDREPKTMFLIVGSGEQYQELIELSAELGISQNIIFTGFQRGKKWRDSYAIADLFVMPSVSEPFGLTPLEAAGYGTPSLISNQSGVSEIFRNCLKVDFWDVNEMANQITAVVRSPGFAEELHNQAYDEYKRLSWQGSAEKLMGWYQHHHENHKVAA